ncbi:MAG: polyisoprenoid-binding protein [Acidimicrobiales bacterium]|nr:MAG: polyisoprenoid-binding protein [Acidimicrobiales bacterium]
MLESTWEIDPTHSSLEFSVRHMMVSKVKGRFTRFTGTIVIAGEPEQSSVRTSVEAASIDTHESTRDGHLRSADFLDVENCPTIEFASTAVRPTDGGAEMTGDLTVHGVTKPVTLEVEFNGTGPDPYGGTRVGFSATTEISRKEFGLEWNTLLEGGGAVVGDKATLTFEVEAVKQ